MDGWRRNVATNTTVLTYMGGGGEEGVRTCGVRNTSFDHSHVATEPAQLSINTFEVNYCTTVVKDIDQLDPLSFIKINLHEFWNAKLIACSLFNDNCSVTIMMNWKGFGRKRSWPNFKVLSRHSHGGTEEKNENSINIVSFRGRESKTGSPEYEVWVLTSRPRRSVWNVNYT
jgi:hypothetical protein